MPFLFQYASIMDRAIFFAYDLLIAVRARLAKKLGIKFPLLYIEIFDLGGAYGYRENRGCSIVPIFYFSHLNNSGKRLLRKCLAVVLDVCDVAPGRLA